MAPDPTTIGFYERLIVRHAQRLFLPVRRVELDFDDVVQTYRIKVWQALEAFDAARWGGDPGEARQRFVFNCLKNMEKDLLKRKRRGELFIDDLAGPEEGLQSTDRFEWRYLQVDVEAVYGDVEDEDVVLPSTLSTRERRIVVLLCGDFTQAEIRRRLGIERSEMDRTVKAIRCKLADWRPTTDAAPEVQPLPLAA